MTLHMIRWQQNSRVPSLQCVFETI